MDAAGNENSEKPILEPLTRREREILDLLAEGLTSGEMAERLTLAVSSVRWYVQQIYGKLGVNGKRQALTRATQLGLLQTGTANLISLLGASLPPPIPGPSLPTGTVTFLFTDIQGSTPLWENHPQQMAAALQVHNAVLRQTIEANGGMVFKVVGDAFQAVFATPHQALKAAIEGQRALQAANWNELGPLKVRMGMHTGDAGLDPGGDEYAVSHCKNRVARIMSAAHGGQVLLSQESAILVRRELPDHVSLKDLGEYNLKGMLHPEHLSQANSDGLPLEFPPLATESRPSHNLPLELTPFIGRQREIVQVQELLHAHRLVTLTGSGGVGKTRLSIQVAGQMLAESPNGVWYVELAPISDPDLVPQIVVTTFGLQGETNQPLMEILSRFLSTKNLLIVLDNCEHLLDACARLTDVLLRQAPRLRILVSSREALGIGGEYAYRVPSLAIPDPQQLPELADLQEYEAVRLFSERARAILPTFAVDEGNALAIARICQRMDGIPLALELAAARLNLLSPEQLAGRLDSAFRLLTGGSRTALPRQQTLRGTIDWSYELLSTPEQILLRRLAVFSGGSTMEGIETICAGNGLEAEQILDLLGRLVNKSMVNAEHKQPEETRYHLLETVRQYAREKLYEAKESQDFYDRHLNYCLELAETIEPQLRTALAMERLRTLNNEIDNLRSALSWALDETGSLKIDAGLRLASALLNLWFTQTFHNEGYTWLKKGLSAEAVIPVDVKVRARACFAAGYLMIYLGRLVEAEQRVEESLSIYRSIDDTNGVVMALSLSGIIYAWTGSFDQANQISTESLEICRTLNDAWLLAWVLYQSGTTLFLQGERLLARPYYEESATIFEQLGDPLHVMDSFVLLGDIKLDQGDLFSARDYYMKALISARAIQSKFDEARNLESLGTVAYMEDDYQQMRRNLLESVALQREMGSATLGDALLLLGIAEINLAHPRQAAPLFKECLRLSWVSEIYADNPLFENVAASLLGIARTALQTNQARAATHLLMAGKRLINVEKHLFGFIEQKEYERGWAEAKDQLGVIEFVQAITEGEALTLKEAVAIALNLDM